MIPLGRTWIFMLLLPLGFCTDRDSPGRGGQESYMHLEEEFPGLSTAAGQLSYEAMLVNTGVRHVLPAFALWYHDVGRIPVEGYRLCRALSGDSGQPETLFYHSFRMLGAPAGGFGPPLSGKGVTNGQVDLHFPAGGLESWQMLPRELRAGIEEYLVTWQRAAQVLDQFRAPLLEILDREGKGAGMQYRDLLMEPWLDRELTDFMSMDLIGEADLRKLSFASRLMASAVSSLAAIEPGGIPAEFQSCVFSTEMGQVGIFGQGVDTIGTAYGLTVELGGDDHYRGQVASPGPESGPICVLVDYAGDDTYLSGEGSLACSCLGISMLMELSGNDEYHSGSSGIASACYGSALLYDRSGDDSYWSHSEFSLGAAHLGSALLVDLDGNDKYTSPGFSQGYGGTLGAGILMDLAGQDYYMQEEEGSSFIQGAGRGRWAEASDGHSLGGGLGVFIDAGGSDHYAARSFSQGASYFTGTGLFFELEGDDHYDALSHSQGYAAHYGLAGFLELGGDDQYNTRSDVSQITQLLGGGRDLSAGWFIEEEGDDIYHFGNRSMGIGDLNGLGILWDRGGHDTCIWHKNDRNPGSPSLGMTLTLPEGMAVGSRMGPVPEGDTLGWFRDDGERTLITRKPESL